MQIAIVQLETEKRITIKDVINRLNKRFINPEQFEQRVGVFCLDIAQELNMRVEEIKNCFYFVSPLIKTIPESILKA